MRLSHRTTLSTRKPVSFWWEKHDSVVTLVQGFAKCCHVITSQEHGGSFGIKAQVTSNKNNNIEQPCNTTNKEKD